MKEYLDALRGNKENNRLSPLLRGAHCGPASPAGLVQRDTEPGQSHTQRGLVERSRKIKGEQQM